MVSRAGPPEPAAWFAHTARRGHHVLTSEQWVAAGIEETFAFFSDAANLEVLTPPFLGFTILSPLPIEMREGTLIEYRLRFMGAPLSWLTRIDSWEPNRSFTDRQLRGPYARWVHTHRFAAARGGTLMRDDVEYALPLAPLSNPVHELLVRPQLARIFAYRRDAVAQLLG
jgi:ligand-binding SRPBCC domain-containing protein